MKTVFTLLMIMLSMAAFSQTVLNTETFPINKFNNSALGGQSGAYNGNLTAWSLKSSTNSIIQINDAPGGGTTEALRFASGTNGADYTTIGFKPPVSNDNSTRQGYTYPDDLSSVNGTVFYYRLKIVDKDGQFKYSNVIMIRKEEKEAVKKDAKAEADKAKKAVKNIQSKVEKATLGDLGVLADLKKKMEGGDTEETKPAE